MIKSLLLVLLLGQSPEIPEKVEFINPGEVLIRGSELVNEGKLEEAIDLYLKISENDTSYIQVQSKLMSIYNANEQFDECEKIGLKLKDVKSKYRSDIYVALGNAYYNSDSNEKALEIYEEGLSLFPFNYTLLYNIGLAHRKAENFEQALSYFQKSASINPYYGNNHIMLGYLSVLQGHTSKAIMSYLMFLAINPDYNQTLSFLENLSSEAIKSEGSVEAFTDNSAFKKYDELIRSNAALDPRFKSAVDLNAVIVRQSELLCSKLVYDKNSDDFWMQFYVPFFTQLEQNGLTPALLYHILQSTENEQVMSWLGKHKKEKSDWIDLANLKLAENRLLNETTLKGENGIYNFWYFDNNDLSAIGNKIDDDTRVGPWAFYYDNYQLEATGKYNKQGERIGEWLYYHENGELQRREIYDIEGNYKEPVTYYHDNGALSIVANYNSENKLTDPLEYYYRCGQIKESMPFENGVKAGKGKLYYSTGQVSAEYIMREDELDGPYTSLYKNGAVEKKYAFKNGLTEGPYESYFIEGQINEKGNYLNDLLTDEWVGYHPNGNLYYKGQLKEDKKIGQWEYYYTNGINKQIINYNDQEELHGEYKTFLEDGTLYHVFEYKNDRIIGFTYYNKQGELVYKAREESGNLPYLTFYSSGLPYTESTLKNGKLNGQLKKFYENGLLWVQTTMVEDEYEGVYEEYYSTGELYIKTNYKAGLKDGYFAQYYQNGQLSHEGWYIQDKAEQWWKSYHPDGSINEINYFISDELNGWSLDFAPINKVQLAYLYENGSLAGLKQYDSLGNVFNEIDLKYGTGIQALLTSDGDTTFKVKMVCDNFNSDLIRLHKNGKIRNQSHFDDNLMSGDFESRNIDGNLILKGQYKDNMQTGIWRWYYANGQVELERNIVRGEKSGPSKRYYYNGQLENECNYSDDEADGPCVYFDQFGNHQITKYYDKRAGAVSFVDVKSKDTINIIEKEKFTINSYFPNGKVAVVQNYNNGKYHGECLWYNQNGSLSEKTSYHNGELQGISTEYHSNGNAFLETPYQNDEKNGIEKEYYENGVLSRETSFVNDNKNGYEILYNRDGSIKSKVYYWNDYVY